ncbi:8119_t:CDS:2 [Dentiscutata erythropus]|uniref:8119_t:CDS:1 n=1 Tax=Dentiscutata erythropus TaxID=1348616 RepID=A0A9N9I6T8_9GLOM|nr:8119_t:CDS:2 [Dentiscutata erythropus]
MNYFQFYEESQSIGITNYEVIVINDEGESSYDLKNLDKSMRLEEVRQHLFFNKNVLMGQNANFCYEDKSIISITVENNIVFKKILFQKDESFAFYIKKDQSKPSFPEIAQRLDLVKGLKRQEDGTIVSASAQALRIKNSHILSITTENDFERVQRSTNKSFEQLWIKSFEEKLSNLLNNFENQGTLLNKYEIMYYWRCSIRLSHLDLEPTEEYVEAVKNALDKKLSKVQRRKELNKVGEKYGFFFAQEIKLGGKLLQVVKNQTEGIMQHQLNDQEVSADKLKVLGGDVEKIARYNNKSEWLESLKFCNNCEIIMYNDKLSLYELLPEKLKLKVRRVNSLKVFYSNVLTTNYFRGHFITKVPKPPSISTFKGYKIFASVFNAVNREPFNTFSIRIDYPDSDNPYFVIHCLEPVTENSTPISLLIPWMVIGYEENLPFEPFSINSASYIKYIWTKNHDEAEIEIPGLITQKHCWVGTCVLHYDENPGYDSRRSEIATSYHFCQKGNYMSICCNQHNLSTNSTNFTGRKLKFKINCAIIFNADDPATSRPLIVEPEGQIWESRENWKQQSKSKDNIFTIRRWLLPKDERLIFASLLGSNSYKQRCHPFFLNINQDHFIIKSLENLANQPINQVNYVAMPKIERNENIPKEEISQPISISSSHDNHLHPNFIENAIRFLKLNNGLIIESRDIYTATNRAFNFDQRITTSIEKCYIKISMPKDRKELFLLKNHIDIISFQLLPQKLIQIMLKPNVFDDDSSFDHVHFEVHYPKVELSLVKETIKPTKEIKIAVDDALNSNKPYRELIKIFDTFGFLISQKLMLGQKLYRTFYGASYSQQLKTKKIFFQNYLLNLNDLFVLWDNQYRFDEIYLMTTDGKSIEKNNIEKWSNDHSKQDFKLLHIINRSEFIPIYEIFEKSISHKIKTILGIDNLPKILMTGVVQVIKNVKYYKINFPFSLESNNYHIFAKVIRSNDKQSFDKSIVKIQSEDKTGFLAIIEKFDQIESIDLTDVQIMWMLVGFPDEVDFYSKHTRDLSILSMESKDIVLDENNNKQVLINVPSNLPKNSIIALSFDESENNESESDESEDEYLSNMPEYEIKHSLRSCIFAFDKEFIEADIPTSKCKHIYLKALGLLIS